MDICLWSSYSHSQRKIRLLIHYDSDLSLRLATDALAYGVGAVISHVFPNGLEKLITFASRTLTITERNYPQLEKEVLPPVYGVKKFHQYLYGCKFSLITDHQSLMFWNRIMRNERWRNRVYGNKLMIVTVITENLKSVI